MAKITIRGKGSLRELNKQITELRAKLHNKVIRVTIEASSAKFPTNIPRVATLREMVQKVIDSHHAEEDAENGRIHEGFGGGTLSIAKAFAKQLKEDLLSARGRQKGRAEVSFQRGDFKRLKDLETFLGNLARR